MVSPLCLFVLGCRCTSLNQASSLQASQPSQPASHPGRQPASQASSQPASSQPASSQLTNFCSRGLRKSLGAEKRVFLMEGLSKTTFFTEGTKIQKWPNYGGKQKSKVAGGLAGCGLGWPAGCWLGWVAGAEWLAGWLAGRLGAGEHQITTNRIKPNRIRSNQIRSK